MVEFGLLLFYVAGGSILGAFAAHEARQRGKNPYVAFAWVTALTVTAATLVTRLAT